MLIRALRNDELKAFYDRCMTRSFPRDELKPFRVMEQMLTAGRYRVWGLADGEEIAGLATVYLCAPGWGLFDYLCVAPEHRSGGLGGRLIAGVLERERGRVLFGESESPDYASDPAMAERRLSFYRRCGAKDAGYEIALFGVVYRVLYWAGQDLPAGEIADRHAAAYRQRLPEKIYERFVTIPWSSADGAPARVDWTEFEGDEDN